MEDDPSYCSGIDCWSGSEEVYFRCQRKCLCCGNKQCNNLGTVGTDLDVCDCDCLNPSFDSENCNILATSIDTLFCSKLINADKSNCVDPFISANCPEACNLLP